MKIQTAGTSPTDWLKPGMGLRKAAGPLDYPSFTRWTSYLKDITLNSRWSSLDYKLLI